MVVREKVSEFHNKSMGDQSKNCEDVDKMEVDSEKVVSTDLTMLWVWFSSETSKKIT